MEAVNRSIEIGVSPDRLYQLLTDFDSYPDFVPNQSAVRVIESKINAWRIEFELSVVRKLRYTLDLVGEPGRSLRWSLVEGDMMKTNIGGWTLEELNTGGTKATYEIAVAFRGFIPKSVAKRLIERTLPSNLEAFKGEAERRNS